MSRPKGLKSLYKYIKRLPPLLPGWDCELVPEGHEEYLKQYDGFCFGDRKVIHIYIHGDTEPREYRKRIGRIFDIETSVAFIYLHEWFHSLQFEAKSFPRDCERICDDFAIAYLQARGIIV